MSEFIVCKGRIPNRFERKIVATEVDAFLIKCAIEIWNNTDDIWTVKIEGRDIDFYLTKAQSDIHNGILFEDTEFYSIITELLKYDFKIAMWYATYCEDLPICRNEIEVFEICRAGIVDISGMCEVYFMTD